MSRKLKLSPLQGQLLLVLEEWGAEKLGTIVATLTPPSLSDFEREIKDLLRIGVVEFYRDLGMHFRYVRLTPEEIDDLPSFEEMVRLKDGRVIGYTMEDHVLAGIALTDKGNEAVWT